YRLALPRLDKLRIAHGDAGMPSLFEPPLDRESLGVAEANAAQDASIVHAVAERASGMYFDARHVECRSAGLHESFTSFPSRLSPTLDRGGLIRGSFAV